MARELQVKTIYKLNQIMFAIDMSDILEKRSVLNKVFGLFGNKNDLKGSFLQTFNKRTHPF